MSEVILLFAGQGAQRVGMGKDFYENSEVAREMFAVADGELGMKLTEVMFEGPEEKLKRTKYCQPALYLHGLIALRLLQERAPELRPIAAAGLSLGEFTAHAAAGTFSIGEGLRLVAKRGEFMEQACDKANGGMAAMLGGDEADVIALAKETGVNVANFNCPGQIVLSGEEEKIDQAVALAKGRGIKRAIKLPVAGAYHSPLMQSAQQQFAAVLKSARIHQPHLEVVANYTAKPVNGEAEIRETLEHQVTGSVRWTETIQYFLSQGHHKFIELGPGKSLAGMVRKTDRSAEVISVEDWESLGAAVASLA